MEMRVLMAIYGVVGIHSFLCLFPTNLLYKDEYDLQASDVRKTLYGFIRFKCDTKEIG